MKLAETAFSELGETMVSERLDFGLEIVVFPKPGYQKKYAAFATPYGAVHGEFWTAGRRRVRVPAGVAHFLEHKMFEQPELNVLQRFSELGASPNAYTGETYTVYLFSTVNRFAECFDLLLDYVQNPYFTEENVRKEQGIIGQEIRMYHDDPRAMVMLNFLQAMYHRHPLRDWVLGTEESIGQITKDLLYELHRTWYHPGRMTICVVGDVEPVAVVEQVRQDMAPRGYTAPDPAQCVWADEPAGPARAEVRHRMRVVRPYVQLGVKGTPPEQEVRSRAGRLRRHLTGELVLETLVGRASPVYYDLYQDGTVTEQYWFSYDWYPQASYVAVGGETANPDRFRERIWATLEAARDGAIDERAFETARRKAYGEFLAHLDVPENQAHGYIAYKFLEMDFFQVPEVIRSIGLDEARAWLQTVIREDRSVASVVEPLDGKER